MISRYQYYYHFLCLYRAFLYQLDGTSFLLTPVSWPMEEKIAHVRNRLCIAIIPIHNHKMMFPFNTSQIAVGYSHFVAVSHDTTVYSWGYNSHGQLGHGDTQNRNSPVVIDALRGKNIEK